MACDPWRAMDGAWRHHFEVILRVKRVSIFGSVSCRLDISQVHLLLFRHDEQMFLGVFTFELCQVLSRLAFGGSLSRGRLECFH